MNVAQLVEKLDSAHGLHGQERRVAYGKALEVAQRLFPDFSGAVDRHRKQLNGGEYLTPLDSLDRGTFEHVFEQVPGLSKAYGAMMTAYAKSEQPAMVIPDQRDYWGTELRFDSDLGRQL